MLQSTFYYLICSCNWFCWSHVSFSQPKITPRGCLLIASKLFYKQPLGMYVEHTHKYMCQLSAHWCLEYLILYWVGASDALWHGEPGIGCKQQSAQSSWSSHVGSCISEIICHPWYAATSFISVIICHSCIIITIDVGLVYITLPNLANQLLKPSVNRAQLLPTM